VLSSHFSPGFAPQVGQWIPNIGLALLFMTPHYANLRREILFTLVQLKISILQSSVSLTFGSGRHRDADKVPAFDHSSPSVSFTALFD
jgi:hypothetical protein